MDAVVVAGVVAMSMLLTSLAAFGFDVPQGWPVIAAVGVGIGLMSIGAGADCAAGGQADALGVCGGSLLQLWLKWVTSASMTSSFAVTLVASRDSLVPPASVYLALASSLCAMLGYWWWLAGGSPGTNKDAWGGGGAVSAPAVKAAGALLLLGLVACLVGALMAPTLAAESSASPAAPLQAASPAAAEPPTMGVAAPPSPPVPPPAPAPKAGEPPPPAPDLAAAPDRATTGDGAAPAAPAKMYDETVHVQAGVGGCGALLLVTVALALKGSLGRLLGTKTEGSYSGSSGDELGRELSAEPERTANPSAASATV